MIYIVIHTQTVSLYKNSSAWLEHMRRFKLGLKTDQLYVRLNNILLSQQANVTTGIIKHYIVAFVYLRFCLPDTRVLSSFEELLHYASGSCKFLRQSAQPPWGNVYIVIHRQTVSL